MLTYDLNLDCNAVNDEADFNWRTRAMLDEICASVANVADDFSADVSLFPEFGEGDLQ